jgi:hypothetical protein
MITVNSTFARGVFHTGYSNPALPSLPAGTSITSSYEISLAESGISNVDPDTGADNLLAAVESDFSSRYAPDVLGLDAAQTVDVNLTVRRVTPSGNRSAIFEVIDPVYLVAVEVEYVVTP